MHKVAMLLVALAMAAIGQKAFLAASAQNSGPFTEFEIDPVDRPHIESGLERLKGKLSGIDNANQMEKYLSSIQFKCQKSELKSKKLISKDRWIEYYSYVNCRYVYGFFGDLIAVRFYLGEGGNIIFTKVDNIPFEV